VSGASVRIRPAALDEAGAAAEWYPRRSARAAEMFLDELDRAIARIGDSPGQFPEYAFGTRRMVLRQFPYLVVFRETPLLWKSSLWPTDVAARAIGGSELNDTGRFVVAKPPGFSDNE
jgi:plasmid stabilization system protein ParE